MHAHVRSLIVATVVLISACAPPSPSRTPAPTSPASPTPPTPPATASPVATASPAGTPVASCGAGCVAPATFLHHGPRTRKVVALTFDDGFNIPACISIVRTLLARQAPATFFPNGQYVRENPSFWQWVAANGFPVGNHTTTHNDARTLGPAALGLSLDSDRRIADAALSVPSINAYRPPYGSYDLQVQEVAAVAGYPVLVGWDVDSMDQTGAPNVAAEVANASTGTNGSIVLMHCGSALTPLALPAIIDGYRAKGFSLVTIPQLLDLPLPGIGWLPPASPDAYPVAELAPSDPQPKWNASPAIDPAGYLHVAYETPAGITYGDDSAGSWQSAPIASTTGSTFVSRPSIALDGSGGVHIVFLSSTAADTELLYEHRASDGTWSPPVLVARLGAPASTATVAIDQAGQPVVAYAVLHGGQAGVTLARPITGGWSSVRVPTTNGTFLSPSIAIDGAGAIYLVERRNGYSDIDETTNASGGWVTKRLFAVSGSAVAYAAFDPTGRLVVVAQESFGAALTLGIGPPAGPLTWTTVTSAGDLSGLTIAGGGSPQVAFSRIPQSGGPSRIWLEGVARSAGDYGTK